MKPIILNEVCGIRHDYFEMTIVMNMYIYKSTLLKLMKRALMQDLYRYKESPTYGTLSDMNCILRTGKNSLKSIKESSQRKSDIEWTTE